jgi:cell division protein FtsX
VQYLHASSRNNNLQSVKPKKTEVTVTIEEQNEDLEYQIRFLKKDIIFDCLFALCNLVQIIAIVAMSILFRTKILV